MKQSLFQEHFFGKKLDCFYGQQTRKTIAKLEKKWTFYITCNRFFSNKFLKNLVFLGEAYFHHFLFSHHIESFLDFLSGNWCAFGSLKSVFAYKVLTSIKSIKSMKVNESQSKSANFIAMSLVDWEHMKHIMFCFYCIVQGCSWHQLTVLWNYPSRHLLVQSEQWRHQNIVFRKKQRVRKSIVYTFCLFEFWSRDQCERRNISHC